MVNLPVAMHCLNAAQNNNSRETGTPESLNALQINIG